MKAIAELFPLFKHYVVAGYHLVPDLCSLSCSNGSLVLGNHCGCTCSGVMGLDAHYVVSSKLLEFSK